MIYHVCFVFEGGIYPLPRMHFFESFVGNTIIKPQVPLLLGRGVDHGRSKNCISKTQPMMKADRRQPKCSHLELIFGCRKGKSKGF